MKKIFLAFLIFSSFAASAQYDSTKQRQPIGTYGFDYKNIKTIGSNIIPYDTIKLAVKDSGAIAYKNGLVFSWNGHKWNIQNSGVIPSFCGQPDIQLTNGSSFANDTCNHVLYVYDPSTQSWNQIGQSTQDGIISGGTVTWTGTGLTYNISHSVFMKFGNYYYSRDTTITLNPADATYGRIDLFALDTADGGRAIKITGTPAPSPVAPQITDYQIQLTTGITLNVGDTTPANVVVKAVYNENVGSPVEWVASSSGTITVDFNSTTTPYNGSKDASIGAYSKNSQLVFTGTTQTVSDQVLSLWVNLKIPLGSKNSLTFQFYNGTVAASNAVTVRNTFGLDPSVTSAYQQVAIPVNSFTWSSQSFNKLVVTMNFSASDGFYLDYVQLQSGLGNVPPVSSTDNGAYHTIGQASDSSYFTINRPNGTKDTVRFVGGSGGGGSGGGTYTASNGLTMVGNDVQLGGTLSGYTFVDADAPYTINFSRTNSTSGYNNRENDISLDDQVNLRSFDDVQGSYLGIVPDQIGLTSNYVHISAPRLTFEQIPLVTSAVTDSFLVKNGSNELRVIGYSDVFSATPSITSGTAAPSSTPAKVGDIYVDITNKKLYFSTGTSSSLDWTIAN